MSEKNGASESTAAIREALTFLESLGYKGGDIHDNLAQAVYSLENTAAVFTYDEEDLIRVAEDIGQTLTPEESRVFRREWFEGVPSLFQEYIYPQMRGSLEGTLRRWIQARAAKAQR